jgi:hypothetical protein
MLWLCVSTHLMEMMVTLSPRHEDLRCWNHLGMAISSCGR